MEGSVGGGGGGGGIAVGTGCGSGGGGGAIAPIGGGGGGGGCATYNGDAFSMGAMFPAPKGAAAAAAAAVIAACLSNNALGHFPLVRNSFCSSLEVCKYVQTGREHGCPFW